MSQIATPPAGTVIPPAAAVARLLLMGDRFKSGLEKAARPVPPLERR